MRLLGAILLISGSCIGAGMLAMPVVTGACGFVPTAITFVLCWAFMTTTALLLLEVNIWLGTGVSIVSMAGRTLGWVGKAASWILFCYLFYLILVAYAAGSDSIFADFWEDYTGFRPDHWVGSVLFTLIFSTLVYFGTQTVDYVNRVLMAGLIVSYLALIAALYQPNIFIQALELAGTFGAVVLFGIMPAMMAWVARYREIAVSKRLVPGGRFFLLFIILVSLFIIVVQVIHQIWGG